MRQLFRNNFENNRGRGEFKTIQEQLEQNVENSNNMADMCNKLDILSKGTESESVDEPNDDETIYTVSTST